MAVSTFRATLGARASSWSVAEGMHCTRLGQPFFYIRQRSGVRGARVAGGMEKLTGANFTCAREMAVSTFRPTLAEIAAKWAALRF